MVHRIEKKYELGNVLREYRESVDLGYKKTTRLNFIEYGCKNYSFPTDWISEKGLQNLELGNNIPSLSTLKKLSVMFQIEFEDLIKIVEPYI